MNEVAGHDAPLSEQMKDFPEQFSTPEIRIDVDEAQKFDMVERILDKARAKAESQEEEGAVLIDIDGARYESPKGWWLIRASNTQPCLVARAEAFSADDLVTLKAELSAMLSEIGLGL
jgi:phosphomannomutase